MLNREGGAYAVPQDSHEYENHGESSHYAWMVPCMFHRLFEPLSRPPISREGWSIA